MKRLILAALLAATLPLGLSAPLAFSQPAVSAPAAAAPMVHISNFTFGPQALKIRAGQTVTWVNDDDIPHSVVAVDRSFRSKVLDTGERFSFTFAHAGSFAYFCGLHPHMTGSVTVTG
ncbi:hypothetical protein GCM10009087_03580 [Sphingomonas oligophenolica]|uniref:Cupredoxin family copper-binding protein n=1 Tax=Sphingomonas oligophenolica TaxID=301154 RepID=A0ABU9Y0H9_9SPHN